MYLGYNNYIWLFYFYFYFDDFDYFFFCIFIEKCWQWCSETCPEEKGVVLSSSLDYVGNPLTYLLFKMTLFWRPFHYHRPSAEGQINDAKGLRQKVEINIR